MQLGFKRDELEKVFESEFIGTMERRKGQQQEIAKEFKTQGLAEVDANVMAVLQVRLMATAQAYLTAIEANNARIEFQLREKGVWI